MAKPYLTIEQQINILKEKNLNIKDDEFAKEILTDIGYFSLIGGYKQSFINPMTRKYEEETSIDDILALYRFDEQLRQLTFSYLNKIEQRVQNIIADSFCSTYGVQQIHYLDRNSYSKKASLSMHVSKLIRILDNIANKNNDHEYLMYQRKTYHNVPLWVTIHAMTFGQLSNMYSLLNSREQSKVSKLYPNVSEKELAQYLSALTLFRNTCAHKERLFSFHLRKRYFPDTKLHHKMKIPKKGNQYILGKNDYFGLVIAFRYLLSKYDFLSFKSNLTRTIDTYCKKNYRITKEVLLSQMGMPSNWKNITRYKP